MTYASGAKKLWEIIDDIAAGLIASPGGYWTDADTTWNTTVKTGNSARRALKYLNGTEEFYVALEQINTSTNYYHDGSYWWYGKGIRVVFSATWDGVLHTYPSSNQYSFYPFEMWQNSGITADLATEQITYYLWYETNGFALIMKPEPTTSGQQQSVLVVVERNPNKYYSDGYTNFYGFFLNNYTGGCQYDGANLADTTMQRSRTILRPFAYKYPDTSSRFTTGFNGYGVSVVPTPSYYAFKSSGNGKVYYVKPIINNLASQLAPIFQAEHWVYLSESVGLVDGDIIAIEGQSTKYLCKFVDSPDYTARMPVAIKYVA